MYIEKSNRKREEPPFPSLWCFSNCVQEGCSFYKTRSRTLPGSDTLLYWRKGKANLLDAIASFTDSREDISRLLKQRSWWIPLYQTADKAGGHVSKAGQCSACFSRRARIQAKEISVCLESDRWQQSITEATSAFRFPAEI